MSRVGWLLTVLLILLLIVGWYFLIFDPTSEEIESVRAETDLVLSQAAQEQERAEQLRQIRQNAPEAEAALSAGQLLVPEEPSIPALFRQLQQATDDAGVRLLSINPSAPAVVMVDEQEFASIGIAMTLQGSYFQIVDLARRIEDPLLTARALRWDAASLGVSEFPELTVSLAGQVYSRGVDQLPSLEPPQEPEPELEPEDGVAPDAEFDEETP